VSLALAAAAMLAAAHTPATDLGWMAGQWREVRGDRIVEEIWTCPAGGVLLGLSRMVREGRTVSFEHMRIHPGPDGRPVFTSIPSGQATASFPLAEAGPGRVRFANPEHDFPRAVTYARDGAALTAAISAAPDGEPPSQSWRFERVAELRC
jgi:hypothetical protein